MDDVTSDIITALINISTKQTRPIDLLNTGVDILHKKNIRNEYKKLILKEIITKIAIGEIGFKEKFDELLHEKTLDALLVIVDSDLLDPLISGVCSRRKNRNCLNMLP